MKLTIFVLSFLVTFAVVLSAMLQVPKLPGKPGHCWAEYIGPLNAGEKKQLVGECQEAECSEDGTMSIYSCGVLIIEVEVNGTIIQTKAEVDYTKPYPECCQP